MWKVRFLSDHAWSALITATIIGAIGPGFQSAPLMAWVFFTALLCVSRSIKSTGKSLTASFCVIYISTCVAYLYQYYGADGTGINQDPTFIQEFPALLVCLLSVVIVFMCFIPVVLDRLTDAGSDNQFSLWLPNHMLFPTAWTLIWLLNSLWSPFNVWGLFAFSQHDSDFVRYLLGIVGPFGVEFLMAWSGCVGCEVLTRLYFYFSSMSPAKPLPKMSFRGREASAIPWWVCSLVGISLLGWIDSLVHVKYLTFQQVNNGTADGNFALRLSCILGVRPDEDDFEPVWKATETAIANRPPFMNVSPANLSDPASPIHIVLWTEMIVSASTPEKEKELWAKARTLATDRTLIAVSYGIEHKEDESTANTVALFAPWSTSSSPDLLVIKRNGVPAIENLAPGTPASATLDVPPAFAGLGHSLQTHICYDFDFPSSWWGVPSSKATVLNPSQTWGPYAFRHFHAGKARLVADALGVGLARCSADGESTLHTPFGGSTLWAQTGMNTDGWDAQGVQPYAEVSGVTFYGGVLRVLHLDYVAVFVLALAYVVTRDKGEETEVVAGAGAGAGGDSRTEALMPESDVPQVQK